MVVTNIYINPSLNFKTIKLSTQTVEPRSKTLGCTKLRTRIKMQDGIMPNENNRGRNSNFLHNPR
jgi:hypothetical protein